MGLGPSQMHIHPVPFKNRVSTQRYDDGNHHVFRGGAWNRYAENLTPTTRKDASVFVSQQ